jgi:ABC-type multidrug transport system ATPase subunit
MNQRFSQLEEAYTKQQDSILEQANANEVLKFEKMMLMQKHAKRMRDIENALATIKLQKANS